MNTRTISVGVAALTVLAGAGAWTVAQSGPPQRASGQVQPKGAEQEGDEEEVIALDKAPDAVRAAALKLAGDAKNITQVIKEEDDEDVVQFEVEYTQGTGADAIKCAAIFSSAGDLMETEKATTESKLPAAVMAALKKDYPKATFADPQAVTKMFYEVVVVVDGKKHEVKVDASGNIEDESEGGDEHGEHTKGADHEKGEKHEGKKD